MPPISYEQHIILSLHLGDLGMSGAKLLYLSCSLIIEEGFAIKDLQRIVHSMQHTAQQAGMLIVTGDGVYINTAGIGIIDENISAGITIMLEREDMNFDNNCGDLANALIELATTSRHAIEINETSLPIHQDVNSACEILGFDPLYIANEGCFALFVSEAQTELTLSALHRHPLGQQACQIGKVKATHPRGTVTLQTAMGISRVLDLLSAEQLPRIC